MANMKFNPKDSKYKTLPKSASPKSPNEPDEYADHSYDHRETRPDGSVVYYYENGVKAIHHPKKTGASYHRRASQHHEKQASAATQAKDSAIALSHLKARVGHLMEADKKEDSGDVEKLYKDFWPANIHIIGKDILRFHAVYWPAFLLAAGIKPPQRVYGHGWILSGDEKMSKSKGNILDPIEIIDIYGLDALRYYLLKEVSFGNDGNISKEKLENCINSDLANNYGNLCQRVILFCEKNLGLKVPEKYNFTNEDLKILDDFKENLENIEKKIDDQNINYYVEYVVNQLFKANKYFNDQAPWTKKDDSLRLNTIVFVSLELIRKISILLYPIIPNTSLKVLNIFSMKEKDIKFDTISNNEYLKDKKEIIKLGILFEKIKK